MAQWQRRFQHAIIRKLVVNVLPKPITVVAGVVRFEVPVWADGKDDDTQFAFEINNLSGVQIAEGHRGGSNDKCEIRLAGYLDIPITLKTANRFLLSKESLKRIVFNFHKRPNGHDACTSIFTGTFILSDDTSVEFGAPDFIHTDDNGPHDWQNLLDVKWPVI